MPPASPHMTQEARIHLLIQILAVIITTGLLFMTAIEADAQKRVWRYSQKATMQDKRGRFILELSRREDTLLYITFRFRKQHKNVFAHRTPRLQIDDNPVHELDDAVVRLDRNRKVTWGLPVNESTRLLRELDQGTMLVLQYYPNKALVREIKIPLKGLAPYLRIMLESPGLHAP